MEFQTQLARAILAFFMDHRIQVRLLYELVWHDILGMEYAKEIEIRHGNCSEIWNLVSTVQTGLSKCTRLELLCNVPVCQSEGFWDKGQGGSRWR